MSDIYAKIDTNFNKVEWPKIQKNLLKENALAYVTSRHAEPKSSGSSEQAVDTSPEAKLYALKATRFTIFYQNHLLDEKDIEYLKTLSPREKALEEIFILSGLKRAYPNRLNEDGKNYYEERIKSKKADFDISEEEISKHVKKRTPEVLKSQSEDNIYFTYYQGMTLEKANAYIKKHGKEPPLSQEMKLVLQYLLANDETRPAMQEALAKAAKKLFDKAYENGKESPARKKFDEFKNVIHPYKDVVKFVTDAISE